MERQKPDLAAVPEDDLTLGDGTGAIGILGAFAVNVRAKPRECRDRGRFVEDGYVIDHFERREHFGAIRLIDDGAGIAFEGADAGVAVDADYEDVTQSLRIAEAANVADVQEVEAAVGPNDRFASLEPGGAKGG